MERRRVIVRGDVQGVFYRDSCRREAISAGVTGWIQNNYDGSVEAVFEGEPGAVDAMCSWSRSGPSHARVDEVDVTEEPPEGLTRFEVR